MKLIINLSANADTKADTPERAGMPSAQKVWSVAIALVVLGALAPVPAIADPTLAEVLARLDAVERDDAARLRSLEKENALLRERVRRLETHRSDTARSTAAAAPIYASAAVSPAPGPSLYNTAPVVAVPHSNWTGFYAGASFGHGDQSSGRSTGLAASGVGLPATLQIILSSAAAASVPSAVPTNPSGFIAGGQVGYNYQIQRLVLGAEADISRTQIKGNGTASGAFGENSVGAFATTTVSVEQHLNWLATARARLGYAPNDNLLLYATGGLAYGLVGSSAAASQLECVPQVSQCAVAMGTGSLNTAQSGWALGGGVEYALGDHWFARAEYLHFELGGLAYSLSPIIQPLALAHATTNIGTTAHFNGDIVRAGLNYKLD
jgi:outer membrane immunogenic protein